MTQLTENEKYFRGILPSDDVLAQCMHCGMCLATCPTYELTKLERSSPRGRIKLIKAVAEGKHEITPQFVEEMSFCLDCQACETTCPAGVKYGSMVEGSRNLISEKGLEPKLPAFARKFGLNFVIANHKVLKFVSAFMAIFSNSFLEKLFVKNSFVHRFLPGLYSAYELSPKFSKQAGSELLPEVLLPEGQIKGSVAFHYGCLMDVAFTDINRDTIDVLLENGYKVIIPKAQNCCGSLHAHNGEKIAADRLAETNLKAFTQKENEYDFLISNSAGCGAFMKEYGHIFETNPLLSTEAKTFSSKVKDIMEFLYEQGIDTSVLEGSGEKVTYHEACHLVHTQKVSEQPKRVLGNIKNITMTPLAEATWCCGSAGIYNVSRKADADKFLERKMGNINKTGAEIILAGNPGCIGQIQYGVRKEGKEAEVMHPVSYLNRLYKKVKSEKLKVKSEE